MAHTVEQSGDTKCVKCKVLIVESTTGIQQVAEGYMCDDCFYQALGDEIDKHPIGPGTRFAR